MIKVKDGYAKLIGTTYQGSATQVLLSNGGDLEYSASSKASTLVQRNASQHIYATYFNSAISDEALTDIGSVYVRNTSDTFIRRVSKTQFYSILDDKFVTLDTTQSITGAKTFSTSVRFANNASIIQNQNDTSNYTTILKWYKNGASRNTYDPSIGQHNTGGDGNGSICILPYPTETSPLGGTVGLFISKGVLKLDGKSVALAENYYTKTESDERYVNVTGDTMTGPLIVKAAITGTQLISTIATGTSPLKVTSTTVVTNLNSDLLDGLHETSFFRARGDQSIASSVPTTTELATSNNLCGSWNVKYTGASGHLVQFNAGSGSTRYMQFYSMYSGSLYWRNSTDSTLNTKSWKTIVDSANYTGIVLKIGTATKGSATLPIYLNAGTPTACSTTLGVSITGNAATATTAQYLASNSRMDYGWNGLNYFNINGTAGTAVKANNTPTTAWWHILRFNHANSSGYYTDLAVPFNANSLYYKRVAAGALQNGKWVKVLDELNYTGTLDSRYVTLTTNQTVSGIKTFSTQQKFTVATGTSPFTVSSTTVVSNLNADMLDGYHANSFVKIVGTRFSQYQQGTYTKILEFTITSGSLQPSITFTWHPSECARDVWADFSINIRSSAIIFYANWKGAARRSLWCVGNGTTYSVWVSGTKSSWDPYGVVQVMSTWGINTYKVGSLQYADTAPSGTYSATAITSGWASRVVGTLTMTAGKFSSKTYNGSADVTVSIPTHFSHLTNDNKNLVIKFNEGTTEGTNMFTYNGSTAKSPNITLTAIGSGLLHNSLTVQLANTTTDSGWSMINSSYNGFILKSIRTQASAPSWILGNYSAGICFGGADTKGVISCAYNTPSIRFAGGNSSKPVWWMGITGSSGATYNLANMWTGTRYWANVAVSTASSTSTQPTFNTCYTSNWFRSTGSTGWYSQTYGGGWHMSDSTWLRAYNGKAVYTSNAGSQAFYAAGGFYSGGSGGNGLTIIGSESTTTRIKGQIGSSVNTAVARYEVQWYSNYARFDVHRGGSTDISKWSFKYNSTEVTYLTTGGHLYANGFHHRSMDSNSYVLLAGGSYKALTDFAKGNAGSATKGVYVTGGTVTAMTYYLNATVNSGASGKLAYYSGTNSIDDYTSTVGSSGTPIYLSSGVPTACTGVMVKYWASYTINNYSGTSVTYSKNGGNYNFVTSTSRRDTGRYTIGTVYPSGQTWYTTLVWAVGNLNASNSSNSSNSLLYCTLIRGYNSRSTYYWYVNTADDASTNNGSFGLFFLCF